MKVMDYSTKNSITKEIFEELNIYEKFFEVKEG
jgi:hypothetical protein